MRWTLSEIAAALEGRLIGADLTLHGVSTDSRKDCSGQLFVALKGERFDAHDYLQMAVQQGAAALLVAREEGLPAGVPAIVVDDTRLALGRMASAWRQRFDIPLVAVTGSNGKTTTKEMIAAIFRVAYGEQVLVTQGNLNNDIGLPLTLLGLEPGHRAAVVEMGMNSPGEIAYLTRIAQPTVAVVTNAQRAHLEGMGCLDGVAREKASIYEGLGQDGVAVINCDDAYADLWRNLNRGRPVLGFGLDQAADVAGRVQLHGLDTRLRLETRDGSRSIELQAAGRHNARNALAAAAVALAAGLDLDTVATGLANFAGVKGRLQRRAGIRGAMLLDDTYNANPDSVRAGIDVLASTVGRQILVLGDMGEIGEACAQYHDEIGGYAKSQGIDRLYALGEASQQAVRNFGEGARHFKTVEALVQALLPELEGGTTVLVKGSRFMKMERIVQALLAPPETAKETD
ncbi:MAG: UDP-N-acetylmuramoyl-tripeptide--D-alanyl-D-alanine ligase [Azovibrio sp.]|uniref:UDP-N-acetylmuramoyl-tripeptide--D-alanyl-D- alanine ligase n=1 Tax=Azovibrio sp. TaxID=1872673 RepID=UPI003C740A0D